MIRSLYLLALAMLLGLSTANAGEARTELEISILTNWNTVQSYGGTAQAKAAFQEPIEWMTRTYKEQLGIDVKVVYWELPDSYSTSYVDGNDGTALLDTLTAFRKHNPQHRDADLTLLFTTTALTSGGRTAAGIAKQGTICSDEAVAVIKMGNDHLEYNIVNHEVGHILGAEHDATLGYIMYADLSSASNFSVNSIAQIQRTIADKGKCMEPSKVAVTPSTSNGSTSSSSSKGGGGSMDWGIIGLLMLVLVVTKRKRV